VLAERLHDFRLRGTKTPISHLTSGSLGCSDALLSPLYGRARGVQRRDELLGGEIFYTLKEAQIVIAGWRRLYNGLRPHSSLGQRPPAPETIVWPGLSLADYGPPSLTREVALGLTQEVDRRMGSGHTKIAVTVPALRAGSKCSVAVASPASRSVSDYSSPFLVVGPRLLRDISGAFAIRPATVNPSGVAQPRQRLSYCFLGAGKHTISFVASGAAGWAMAVSAGTKTS
jgi:hypothetical protein